MRSGPLVIRALDLVDFLSHRYGKCFASERAQRELMTRHEGRAPGERSISRVLRKAKRDGLIVRRRIFPGEKMPNGQIARYGTTTNVLLSRQEQRSRRRRKAKEEAARARAASRPRQPLAPRRPPRDASDDAGAISLAQWLAGPGQDLPAEHRELLLMATSPRGRRARARAHPPPD
jgi:hypothetical protein